MAWEISTSSGSSRRKTNETRRARGRELVTTYKQKELLQQAVRRSRLLLLDTCRIAGGPTASQPKTNDERGGDANEPLKSARRAHVTN